VLLSIAGYLWKPSYLILQCSPLRCWRAIRTHRRSVPHRQNPGRGSHKSLWRPHYVPHPEFLGHLREFAPGVGRVLESVFFQQVCSIAKQHCIRIKGDGDKLAFNGVVLDDARKELGGLLRSEIWSEIGRVGPGNSGPEDVDQVNVNIWSLRRPIRLPQHQNEKDP
jgi:hypothetical protein